MTSSERELLREIADLKVRVKLLESETARAKYNAKDRHRRLLKENGRLRALLKAEATKRMRVVDEGRYLHGVMIANGLEVAHGE